MKCVDVVDSLSDERPFAEKILVDIGNRNPLSAANNRTYQERDALGRLMPTRG